MMEQIRVAANSIIVKIIFAIIILGFIFTGVGGFFGFSSTSADDQRRYIAKVDGEGIGRIEFEQQVNNVLASNPATSMTEDLMAQIRQRVFLTNVDNVLGIKLAKNVGITISDRQVQDAIRQQDVFFVDGKFNNDRYLALLQQSGISPNSYGESTRSQKQTEQLLNGLISSDFMVPVESEISQLVMQQRGGELAIVAIDDVIDSSSVVVTDNEVKQFYQANKDKFAYVDSVKVKYIVNSYADALKKAKVPTEDDCKAFYQENISQYTQPAKYEYSLLQVNNENEAKQIIQDKKIEQSLSESNNNSLIDLGWFTQGAIPDYLTDLHLSQKGEAAPLQMDSQYYIALLTNVQQAESLPFQFVAEKIKNEIVNNEASAIYNKENDKLVLARNKNQTVEEIAHESGLTLFAPEDWQTKTDMNSIASNNELQNVLFGSEMIENGHATKTISDVIEISEPKATYIVQVTGFKPEGIAPYDEVQQQIRDDLTNDKAKAIFQTELGKIVANLNNGTIDSRIHFSKPYDITRFSTDLAQSTIDMIFSLPVPMQDKETYGFDINLYNQANIAGLKSVKMIEQERDFSSQILNINAGQMYNSFGADLRSKAKIELMPDANL